MEIFIDDRHIKCEYISVLGCSIKNTILLCIKRNGNWNIIIKLQKRRNSNEFKMLIRLIRIIWNSDKKIIWFKIPRIYAMSICEYSIQMKIHKLT